MVILTEFTKKDFDEVLKNYCIGSHKSHRHIPFALGNTNYKLVTTKGKYLLKIFEHEDIRTIDLQIKIQKQLYKHDVKIPKIILHKNNKELTTYKGKHLVIADFVKVKHPHHFNEKKVIELAKNIAKLHKVLLTLKLQGDTDFPPADKFWSVLKKCEDPFVVREGARFNKNFQSLDKSKMRKSIIHSDLNPVNLLMDGNKFVAFIDWDDAHRDYLVRDISIFLEHSILTAKSIRPHLMMSFLKEYNKDIKLSPEEKKAIYHLIKLRLLSSINWCYPQCKNHPDLIKDLMKHIKGNKDRYKVIDSISADDFVKFFD